MALGVVLGVALFVGAGRPASRPSPAQRAAAIEADVRCPSCEDISVAQSSAPTARAIRQAVTDRVAVGASDAAVEDYLVSRYGPGILLRPPAHGTVGLVWLVPVAALAVALGILGTFFWRRRRVVALAVSDEDRVLVERALAGRGGR
jgi:cytochrome c-type biogenesis protein CcmH